MLNAQITTNEQPYGLKAKTRIDINKSVVLSTPDLSAIQKEDQARSKENAPERFAYPIPVNNPYKMQTRDFGDASSCHININCPQASAWTPDILLQS